MLIITSNRHDFHVIAVWKNGIIFGYVSHKISCLCSVFIQRKGEIHCIVTNSNRYSADLAQGGMEIPYLTFKITNTKMKKLIS